MAIFGTGGEEFDDEGADPLRQQEIENLLLWGGARNMRKEENFDVHCFMLSIGYETYGRSKKKRS